MGLTILAFLVAPLLVVLALPLARRGRRTAAGRYALLALVLFAGYCLSMGLVSATAVAGQSPTPLLFSRLAAVMVTLGAGALLAFAVSFSTGSKLWAALLSGLSLVLAAYVSYRLLFTSNYMVAIVRLNSGQIARFEGRYYALFSDVMGGMAMLSGLVHGWRAISSKDRVQRQRSAIALIGISAGVFLFWFFARAFPARNGVRESFDLLPLAVLLMGGSIAYAFLQVRLFDWRAIGRTAFHYAALALAIGVPSGLALAAVSYLRILSPVVPLVTAPLVFILAVVEARSFSRRFFERAGRRGDYREDLESELAHVDLAQGRDAVLRDIYRFLSEALDFSDFTVIIEDDRGLLRTVYAPTGGKASIERGSPLAEALERSGATVLLKSETMANSAYEGARQEFLGLFESLKAEAVIIIREGRHVIGLFAIGARRTGADFTDYDYDAFRAIYGKLFVFAYYLKNVARESILHTVDRELALSDQIIRFALEKVDRVEHPKADTAWAMRSTRRLGGDFVDFVRLSQDRWFFVMGDVSGKGLSASMNMLILKSMVRTFLRVEKDFVGLVARVNSFIKENLPKGTFFAGVFGYFDFSKDAFYYINCGIPTILLYSPSFDTFIEVQGEGRILGFVRDVRPFLKPRKLVLPPGSALVAATDGVTDSESLRGERFGKDRLRRAVHGRLGLGAREIADGVIGDLYDFTDKKQEDDITLLVMKFQPRSAQ